MGLATNVFPESLTPATVGILKQVQSSIHCKIKDAFCRLQEENLIPKDAELPEDMSFVVPKKSSYGCLSTGCLITAARQYYRERTRERSGNDELAINYVTGNSNKNDVSAASIPLAQQWAQWVSEKLTNIDISIDINFFEGHKNFVSHLSQPISHISSDETAKSGDTQADNNQKTREFTEHKGRIFPQLKCASRSKGFLNFYLVHDEAERDGAIKGGFMLKKVQHNEQLKGNDKALQEALIPSGVILQVIGTFNGCFVHKFGTPRQGLLCPSTLGVISFDRRIAEAAFDGLNEYSHIWVIFLFDDDKMKARRFVFNENDISTNSNKAEASSILTNLEDEYMHNGQRMCCDSITENFNFLNEYFIDYRRTLSKPKVRAPHYPGSTGSGVGVFACRTPCRPSPVGLTLVALNRIVKSSNGCMLLFVSGVDMISGTSVIDIKPLHLADLPDTIPYEHQIGHPILQSNAGPAVCRRTVRVANWTQLTKPCANTEEAYAQSVDRRMKVYFERRIITEFTKTLQHLLKAKHLIHKKINSKQGNELLPLSSLTYIDETTSPAIASTHDAQSESTGSLLECFFRKEVHSKDSKKNLVITESGLSFGEFLLFVLHPCIEQAAQEIDLLLELYSHSGAYGGRGPFKYFPTVKGFFLAIVETLSLDPRPKHQRAHAVRFKALKAGKWEHG